MVTVNNVSTIHFYVNYHISFTKLLSPFKSLTIVLKNKTKSVSPDCEKHKVYKALFKFI